MIADEEPISNMIDTDDYIASGNTFAAAAEALKERGIGGKAVLVGDDLLPMEGWLELERRPPHVEGSPRSSPRRSRR